MFACNFLAYIKYHNKQRMVIYELNVVINCVVQQLKKFIISALDLYSTYNVLCIVLYILKRVFNKNQKYYILNEDIGYRMMLDKQVMGLYKMFDQLVNF